jgi:hypothetical protein
MVVDAWRNLRAELRAAPPLSLDELAINGGDLKRLGLKPGPVFGEILSELLDQVLDEPDRNQKGSLVQEVEEILRRRAIRIERKVDAP